MTQNRHSDRDHPSGPVLFLLRIAARLRLPGAKARLLTETGCKKPPCGVMVEK